MANNRDSLAFSRFSLLVSGGMALLTERSFARLFSLWYVACCICWQYDCVCSRSSSDRNLIAIVEMYGIGFPISFSQIHVANGMRWWLKVTLACHFLITSTSACVVKVWGMKKNSGWCS